MKELSPAVHLLVLLAFFASAGTVLAQTAPAVSELNGKLDYAGGWMDSAEGHNVSGSISFPLTHQFGFQADALYSRITDLDFYGGAGHLFWRDPDIGLVGLTGGYLYRSGVDTFQIGAEGEYYLDRFTFGCFAGAGSIKYANTAPFIDTSPTRFVGQVSAGFYPIDDLLVSASYTTAFRDNLVKGDLEYQTPISGLTLTAEAAYGDNGYDHLLFGIRYYFGGKKTLRDRHRQDDPHGLMQQILHGLGLYGAEYNRAGRRYAAEHPAFNGGSFDSYGCCVMEVERGPLPPLPPLPPSQVQPPTTPPLPPPPAGS